MPSLRILEINECETHFLTMRVIEWIYLFSEPAYSQKIIESLNYCQKEKGLLIHAYIIMTNHLHLILSAKKNNLSSIIRDFKRYTTREFKKLILRDNRIYITKMITEWNRKRKNHTFQIWNDKNWALPIYTEGFFLQKLDYIHNNPVEKEYVSLPEEWLYSSARNYILDDNSLIDIDIL